MLPERLQDYNIKYESKKKFKAIKSAYMFFPSQQQWEIIPCEHITDLEHNSAEASKSVEADLHK